MNRCRAAEPAARRRRNRHDRAPVTGKPTQIRSTTTTRPQLVSPSNKLDQAQGIRLRHASAAEFPLARHARLRTPIAIHIADLTTRLQAIRFIPSRNTRHRMSHAPRPRANTTCMPILRLTQAGTNPQSMEKLRRQSAVEHLASAREPQGPASAFRGRPSPTAPSPQSLERPRSAFCS
jgi:hypothetical protein